MFEPHKKQSQIIVSISNPDIKKSQEEWNKFLAPMLKKIGVKKKPKMQTVSQTQ